MKVISLPDEFVPTGYLNLIGVVTHALHDQRNGYNSIVKFFNGKIWYFKDENIAKLPAVYSVKHPGNNKVFNFKSNLELQIGDKVLCDTVYGITTGTVVGIDNDYPATKWIISKLDTTEYDMAMKEERRQREKEEIKTRINDLEKELAAEKERLNQL